MPQSTGARYAGTDFQGGDAGNVWTNPQNARQATEPDEAAYASVQIGLTTTTKSQWYRNFTLLAEDGGPIPAGATIVSVTLEWRLRVLNSTGGLDDFRGKLWGEARRGGTLLNTSLDVNPAAKSDSNWLTRTVTYAGTVESPQTAFSRADLAHNAAAQGGAPITLVIDGEKFSGLTGNSNFRCAWLRVTAEWVLFADGPGGAKNSVKAQGTATAIIEAPGGGKTDADSGAEQTVIVSKAGGGVSSPCKAGGAAKPLVNPDGGAAAGASAGDNGSTVLATPDGGGKTASKAGAGTSTVTSYAISGEARSGATNATLPNVRVDVYRTADHAHMGRDTTDAVGAYAVAIPLTGNETARFWARFYLAGAPNQFATTDEDLALVETVVQTA